MRGIFDSYIFWVAWRNLVSKKHGGLTFMTIVSILGVTIGVASLIVVLSVMGGFESDLKQQLLNGDPHLEIVAKNQAAGFSLVDHPVQSFAKLYPQAESMTPYTKADVIIKSGKRIAGASLIGMGETLFSSTPKADPRSPWLFEHKVIEGGRYADIFEHKTIPVSKVFYENGEEVKKYHKTKPPAPPIILGVELGHHLELEVGSEVMILSPHSHVDGMLGGAQLVHRYVVAGFFKTEFGEYDSRGAVVSLHEGRKYMPEYDSYLDEAKYVTGVGLRFADPTAITNYKRLGAKASELDVVHWRENNKAILLALKLEKYAMSVILLLIVVVAAFSISGTLIMTVYHRRGHVALFRAIGMNRSHVASLFITHGLVIGLVGVVAGLLVGLGLCSFIANFRIIPMLEGAYNLNYIPVKFLPMDYVVICFAACLLSLLAAVYPALAAAKGEPSQGLRCL